MEHIDLEKLEQNAEKASALLKSMSHPSRLLVLCHLLKGEISVSELNRIVPLSQSALSQHLSGMRQAELVETRRESQMIYYRLKNPAVAAVIETLYGIYCNPNEKES